MDIDAPKGTSRGNRQQPVVLRQEKQAAPVLHIPENLLLGDALIVHGDPQFPGPADDGVLCKIVLAVVVGIEGHDMVVTDKIFKTGQKYIRAEIHDLHPL